jgi:hypothetical protein
MDITNSYSLFHPNYLASKKDQIKLEQLLRLNSNEIKTSIFKPSKLKVWRVENKKIKKYVPQDSKYNFKQIVKNFKLNREQLKHGYSNKYINIFTNLLNEKNLEKYPKKRLSLVDYRKKILKKKLNTSFEEFVQKEPLSERFNFSKQKMNNIYLTTIIKKLQNEKNKQKNSSKKIKKYKNNRIFLKDLLNESNSNDNKFKLKLNTETYNNNNLEKIIINNEKNNHIIYRNKLYGSSICNTSISESNIIIPTINKNSGKIINNYNEQNDDEDKYFEKVNPKEEFIQKRNKAVYIDYLKNKYNFYSNKNMKDLKNYSEIKKRQIIFESGKEKIEHPLEFPYKKEFFKKFNRQYDSKNKIKELIKQGFKNDEISIKYFTPKRKQFIKY